MNEPKTPQSEDREAYLARMRNENDAFFSRTGKRRRAFFLTFGCQQNVADSEKLAGTAVSMGYEIADRPEDADLIVVNTCVIREHAEKKALSTVGQFKHLKAKNPGLVIVLCGCMVSQDHRAEEVRQRYPYVDLVFGPSSLHRFPQLLCERLGRGKRVRCSDEETLTVPEGLPIRRESNYRAWVSVMYGCNNFCSYCIVPYVRGRERSREPEQIIDEVRGLVDEGYRDITLLGQNVNSYGRGTAAGWDFADLLAALDRIDGDFRLRFMTSHPKDAGRKLIDVMAGSRHVAHQFHLPLQSGSDAILARMNRRYDTAKYLETLDYLRERIPDVTVSSDIIVGFPGETEEDFEGTLSMLRRARFDMIFSFIYSPRKGTPAAAMEDQVPPRIQHERFDRLLALQNGIATGINQTLVGKPLRVLCDGVSKNNPDLLSGRTDGNKIAFFRGPAEWTGKYVGFTAERADAFALYGDAAREN